MNIKQTKGSWLAAILLAVITLGAAKAQTPKEFTLSEAIRFATEQNITVKNAQLDALGAEARINEVRSAALPQVSINSQLTYNAIIQRFILPAGGFGPNTDTSGAGVTAIPFGVKYQGNVAASVNQLLYDASYKLGLKAAATYRELAQKNITASKITVAEQVAKAYYSALVSEERIKLLDLNIGRVDSLLKETRVLNQQGFVEKIDIDRLEVQLNNLKAERQNVQNLVSLSYYLLKFQMGLGINETIVLTTRITDANLAELEQSIQADPNFDYNQRIEFTTLQTQIRLADLDYQSIGKLYFPRLAAFATYGHNNGRNNFIDFWTARPGWFNSAAVGLNLSIPVFDGFQKKYAAQQRRITLDKTKQSADLLRNSIDLQIRQSQTILQNSLQSLLTQQRNMELAKEIVRVSRIKYKEGVGSNIEVLNAETSLREAQTNYFTTLYDFMIARVDFEKATGKLFTGN